MALALAARPELSLHVVHDERVAAFVALGLGLDGVPAVLLCTSGTAAANLHPAVVEAGLSEVPMVVLTADRPPELRGVGAPQTIDQIELFGRSVRWFHDAPVPDESDPASWRPLAQRVFATAGSGPVHLNLPFREPLLGEVGELPEPIGPPLPVPRGIAMSGPVPPSSTVSAGVIIAGGRHGVDPFAIETTRQASRLADTGRPAVGLPRRRARRLDLRLDLAPSRVRPGTRARDRRAVRASTRLEGPHAMGRGVAAPPSSRSADQAWSILITTSPGSAASTTWRRSRAPRTLRGWRVGGAPTSVPTPPSPNSCRGTQLTEPGVARTLANWLPDDAELVVASSMPVRDLEWFGGARARAHANRGANGIDGVVSTALGRALTGRTTVVWVGDIAFVHDSNALVGSRRTRRRPADRRRRQRRRWDLLVPAAGRRASRRPVRAVVRHPPRHRHRGARRRPSRSRGHRRRRRRAVQGARPSRAVGDSGRHRPRRERSSPRRAQQRGRGGARLMEGLAWLSRRQMDGGVDQIELPERCARCTLVVRQARDRA